MKRYTDAIAAAAPWIFAGVLIVLALAQYVDARAELDQVKADYSQHLGR